MDEAYLIGKDATVRMRFEKQNLVLEWLGKKDEVLKKRVAKELKKKDLKEYNYSTYDLSRIIENELGSD